jgi:hypothetical protein
MNAPFKLYLNESERKRLDARVEAERKRFPGISASEVIKRAVFEKRLKKIGHNVQLIDVFLLGELHSTLNGLIHDYRNGKDIILGLNHLKDTLEKRLSKV